MLYLHSLFISSLCPQKYKWYIKANSYCAKMSLESSSKPALFGSLYITPIDRYSAATIIIVNCRLLWYVPQVHVWTNSVHAAAVILFQTIIYIHHRKKKNSSCQTIFSFTHFKTLVSSTAHSKESLLLLLDSQAAESLHWVCLAYIYSICWISPQCRLTMLLHCAFFLKVARQKNPRISLFPPAVHKLDYYSVTLFH